MAVPLPDQKESRTNVKILSGKSEPGLKGQIRNHRSGKYRPATFGQIRNHHQTDRDICHFTKFPTTPKKILLKLLYYI